ncbi:phospholipase D Active site motif protein [Pyricularia oryzae]|nr:phospholipase D Active site motif protein [Pyricularia oryzae]KAI7915338.1 phospholipase D Active site motif protein [Pyricularia oryzae]
MSYLDFLYSLGDFAHQLFVVFPYSAYTIPRSGSSLESPHKKMNLKAAETEAASADNRPEPQVDSESKKSLQQEESHRALVSTKPPPRGFGDEIFRLCTAPEDVSSLLASNPDITPNEAWEQLYGKGSDSGPGVTNAIVNGAPPLERLERAARCGKWGENRPSDLFLEMYHDALTTLDEDLTQGVVSPSLMGSNGVMPLTVISTIPDIVRHMANLIVAAEHDVLIATNFWQNSEASKYITDAIRELSRRAEGRDKKVVVKVMYDRGSVRQVFDQHHIVPEKDYTGKAVGLPKPSEIPNVDLEVMNYHNPLLGTFHAKYMVVDRRIAVLQSNNIQDNDNLEMMVHLEGPIVDSVYDMALLSWHKALTPPLPTANKPAATETPRCFDSQYNTEDETQNGYNHNTPDEPYPEHTTSDPHYDATISAEVRRVQASVTPIPGESRRAAVTKHLNHTTNKDFTPLAEHLVSDSVVGEDPEKIMTPYVKHQPHQHFPMALVNRPPYGPPKNHDVKNPQNAAWLAALRCATRSVFIQSPTLNAEPLLPAIIDACERGVEVTCYICLGYNDIGELLPMQGGHNEMIAHRLHTSLSEEARPRLHYHWYVAKDATAPLHQGKRQRSCHIKLLVADWKVAVVGSGNQDTQSWCHSQEVNVLLDLPEEIAEQWREALEVRNQNTGLYGLGSNEDGVWRDAEGREADEAIGIDPGRFSWGKGIMGAVKRLKGTGGF